MSDNKKITRNSYIDIDFESSADNMLIIGNTMGFFGEFYRTSDNKHPVALDIFNTNPAISSRLLLISNILKSKKTIVVITNSETLKYYELMFTYIKYNICKINKKNLKFKCINKDEEYIDVLNEIIKSNMKFDYIIQNPPYSGSFHLNFLEKGLDILSEKGKMTIIEPATWLINVRKNGKAKLYDEIKKRLGKHVYKVVIENYNKEFDTAMYVPFAVTYIDMDKEYDSIDFWCCGEHRVVNDIYDCNMIGSYDMIWSILNKIKAYGEKIGTMKDHIYKEWKTKVDKETWFCKYGDIISVIGCYMASKSCTTKNPYMVDIMWRKHLNDNEFISGYSNCYINHVDTELYNGVPKSRKRGNYSNGNIQYSDKIAYCLFGTKTELKNWKYFVFNNSLPLFVSICLVIDQHNMCKDVLCWLTDRQYTDEEIYQLLGITEEEKQFIDKTIKKYERKSPWFKRYVCGKDSVSNEEVQKFINSL